jgi:hypothetical protein
MHAGGHALERLQDGVIGEVDPEEGDLLEEAVEAALLHEGHEIAGPQRRVAGLRLVLEHLGDEGGVVGLEDWARPGRSSDSGADAFTAPKNSSVEARP